MDKSIALTNCLAVFHYALWRYPNSIVGMTFNGYTYSVDINLEHNDYDSEKEIELLKQVIAAGADISHLKPFRASYNIIVIRYRLYD